MQCAVSGYLSFFSMDCLMMRWYVATTSSTLEAPINRSRLIIYSPIASIIRLITASFIYYVGTNFILQYSGSNLDPSLLLPAWISIAAVGPLLLSTMKNSC